MKCFRCQGDNTENNYTKSFVAVNVGRDNNASGVGDIHLYICQKCCGALVAFLKETPSE